MAKPPKGKERQFNEFHKLFHKHLKQLKDKHGSGVYSWAEGVTRQAMRKAARRLARKEMKEAKQNA